MKRLVTSSLSILALLIAPACYANMTYNPEHDEALKELTAVESANINLQYQCGKYSLFISSFATASDLNGRNASVTGKITSEKSSYDISKKLELAISRNDVLTGQMSVACNADKGAFRLEIIPNEFANEDSGSLTTVSIFADGTVEGSRNY